MASSQEVILRVSLDEVTAATTGQGQDGQQGQQDHLEGQEG